MKIDGLIIKNNYGELRAQTRVLAALCHFIINLCWKELKVAIKSNDFMNVVLTHLAMLMLMQSLLLAFHIVVVSSAPLKTRTSSQCSQLKVLTFRVCSRYFGNFDPPPTRS